MKQIFKTGEKIGPHKLIFINEEPQKGYKRYLKCKCAECGEPFVGRIDSIKSGVSFKCKKCKEKKHLEQCKKALEKANSEEVKNKCRKYNPGDIIHNMILFKEELDFCYEPGGHKRRKGKFINLETGIEYEALLKSVLNKKSLGLGGRSKGEIAIRKILNEMKINFITEYTFEKCINPKTGHKLRFDFYLPDYNCCIEYNGEQHYKNTFNLPEDIYDEYLQNSERKKEYCKKNNINLIVIPY